MNTELIILRTILAIIIIGAIWVRIRWGKTVRYYLDNLEC